MFYLNDFNIASFQKLTPAEAKQKAQEVADTQKPIDPFVGQQAAIGTATVGSGLVAKRANESKKKAGFRQLALEKQLSTKGNPKANAKVARRWKDSIQKQVAMGKLSKKAKILTGLGVAGLGANYLKKKLFTSPENKNS